MDEMWARFDLQVLETVAAPKDFPMRFAWSARNVSDLGNILLRNTVIAACTDGEAEVNRNLSEVVIPLGQ